MKSMSVVTMSRFESVSDHVDHRRRDFESRPVADRREGPLHPRIGSSSRIEESRPGRPFAQGSAHNVAGWHVHRSYHGVISFEKKKKINTNEHFNVNWP